MLCRSGDCNNGLRGSNSKMELVMLTFIKVITAMLQRCKASSPHSLSDSLRGQCPSPSSEGPAWSIFTYSLHLSVVTVICSADFVDVFILRHFGGVASLGGRVHLRVSPHPDRDRTLGTSAPSKSSPPSRTSARLLIFSFDYCLGQRTECLDDAQI